MPFAATAVIGAARGGRLAQRIPKRMLQLGFAVFLMCVAAYTAWRALPQLL